MKSWLHKRHIKSFGAGFVLVLLALLVIPLLASRLGRPEPRSFEWVRLEETSYEEITFRNRAQELQLAGMLFVPAAEGPFPAAVIIHGSGTSRRDSGWYLTLTRYLQEHGVAVLLPDKRGSEQSQGDWRNASFEDLATDTVAAVRYLRSRTAVAREIGVVGLSQGGHIAPLVAARTDDLAFVVNIVGGAVPLHELLVYEETHNLRESGIPPGLADLLAYPAAWSIIGVRQREFWRAVGNFDPAPYWKEITVPSLVLYGEDDTNVPSHESAEILRSLGNPNIEVTIYEGSGHALESPQGEGRSIFRQDALEEIRDFIRRATARRASR